MQVECSKVEKRRRAVGLLGLGEGTHTHINSSSSSDLLHHEQSHVHPCNVKYLHRVKC